MAVKNSRNLATTAAATSDPGSDVIEDALNQLEDTPVAPGGNQQAIPNGRASRTSIDTDERDRIAKLYQGIRQQYFDLYGTYPSDIALQDEGYKHLASREFGINLMTLGGKLAAATSIDKEAAYLQILQQLGVDTAVFKIPTLTGGFRFNWRYHRQISYNQAVEIKNKILAAFSNDLRRDKPEDEA